MSGFPNANLDSLLRSGGASVHPGFSDQAPSFEMFRQSLMRAHEEGLIDQRVIAPVQNMRVDLSEIFNRIDTQSDFGDRISPIQLKDAPRSPSLDAKLFQENAKNVEMGLSYRGEEMIPPRLGRSRAERLAAGHSLGKGARRSGGFWDQARQELMEEGRLDTTGQLIDADPVMKVDRAVGEIGSERSFLKGRRNRVNDLIEARAQELEMKARGPQTPRVLRTSGNLAQVSNPASVPAPARLGGSKPIERVQNVGKDVPYLTRGYKDAKRGVLKKVADLPGEPDRMGVEYGRRLGTQVLDDTQKTIDRIVARKGRLSGDTLKQAEQLEKHYRGVLARQANTMDVLMDASKYVKRGAPLNAGFNLDKKMLAAFAQMSSRLMPAGLRAILRASAKNLH